ncbi:MAG: hypothetical protein ACJ8C4_16505 [Gemmataceae bacterium]
MNEQHYTDVNTFRLGDWVGKVWTVAMYNEKGRYICTEYITEFVCDATKHPTTLTYEDVQDLLVVLDQIRDFVSARRKESLSVTSSC